VSRPRGLWREGGSCGGILVGEDEGRHKNRPNDGTSGEKSINGNLWMQSHFRLFEPGRFKERAADVLSEDYFEKDLHVVVLTKGSRKKKASRLAALGRPYGEEEKCNGKCKNIVSLQKKQELRRAAILPDTDREATNRKRNLRCSCGGGVAPK